MNKRVYRGKCPYESFFEGEFKSDCRNCDCYFECKRKERKRKKRLKYEIRRFAIIALLIVLALGVVVTLFWGIKLVVSAMTQDANSTTQPPATYEPQEESENGEKPNYDFSASTEVSKPIENPVTTETPEIHIDVDINVNVEVSEKPDVPSEETLENPSTGVEPTISAYEPGTVYVYNLTYEEKVYIAKVIYKEARGEPYEGQVAVAAVILNRFVSSDRRFNTESIYSVVTQSGQFASIKGVTMKNLNSVKSCMQAVEDACLGWDPTRVQFPNGAIFFFNPDGDLNEAARAEREGIETLRIGLHLFHVDMNSTH